MSLEGGVTPAPGARLDALVARLLATDDLRLLVLVAPGGWGLDLALDELAVRLQRSRITVTRWRGRRLERDLSWSALADLLGTTPDRLDPVTARRGLVERVGHGGALVVDDAQWLDTESAAALVAAADRAAEHDLRVVVAHRPWPDAPELSALDLAAATTGAVVEWAPLAAAELADRIEGRTGSSPTTPDLAAVHRASGGVPWVADVLDGATSAGPPDALVAAARARAGSLSSGARTLLLARVLVGTATPEVEAAVLEGDLSSVGQAVGAVGAEGLLAPGDDRPLPIVGAALRVAVSDAEQAEVLRRVDAARAAAGLMAVDLVRALDALERGAPDDALVAAEPVRTDPSRSQLDREAAAWVGVAVLSGRGLHTDAAALVDAVPTSRSADLAALLRLLAGDPAPLPPADPDGPMADRVVRRTLEGLHQSLAGSPDEALARLTEAVDLAELHPLDLPLPDSPHAIAALVALAVVDLPRATRFLQRAIESGVGGAAGERRHRMLAAWVDVRAGRTGRAVDEVRALEVEAPAALTSRDRLVGVAIEAGVARRAGDVAQLTEVWSRAKPVLLGARPDLLSLSAVGELCAAATRLGAAEAARPVRAQADALLARAGSPSLWSVPLRWDALQALSVAGAAEDASGEAEALAAMDVSLPTQLALRRAAGVWVQLLAGGVGQDDVAACADELSGIGLAWEASHLVGQAAVRSTDSRVTRSLLGKARDLKGSVGTEPERLAADTGLSERELEIGLLVRDGLTHREIGERLFISPKTVEHHVARIRQKLGATSRAEMLAALQQIAAR